MRKLAMILTLFIPTQLWADDFDYYVFSLSWSASFCDIEGDARQSDQCDVEHDYKWKCTGFGRSIIRVGPPTVIHPNAPLHVE